VLFIHFAAFFVPKKYRHLKVLPLIPSAVRRDLGQHTAPFLEYIHLDSF